MWRETAARPLVTRAQAPAGPSDGSTINHMGVKVKKLADVTARFAKDGYTRVVTRPA